MRTSTLASSTSSRRGGGGRRFSKRPVAMQPRALGTAAGILFLLGWIPGLPGFPLLTLAMLSGAGAYYFRGTRPTVDAEAAAQEAKQIATPEPATDPMDDLTPIDLLELE